MPVIPGNQDYYFFFNVSRKFGHAMANVVIPLYFLSFCACLSFLIPATCGERLGFVITIQLAVTFATQMIEQEAAPSGDFPQPVIFGFVQYVIGKECILWFWSHLRRINQMSILRKSCVLYRYWTRRFLSSMTRKVACTSPIGYKDYWIGKSRKFINSPQLKWNLKV